MYFYSNRSESDVLGTLCKQTNKNIFRQSEIKEARALSKLHCLEYIPGCIPTESECTTIIYASLVSVYVCWILIIILLRVEN